MGTGKAVLYDISDNTNQAVGMTFLTVSWASGMILGPFFGGLSIFFSSDFLFILYYLLFVWFFAEVSVMK